MIIRPNLRYLDDNLIEKIIFEARELLIKLGISIHNKEILALLGDFGADVDLGKKHVKFTNEIIDKALSTIPSSFKLYDVSGNLTHDFSDYNVHFTPGSAAIRFVDLETHEIRKPNIQDYINYTKVTSMCKNIDAQSTALVPSDVPNEISDSYRLYLSLLYGEKPVVTGTFSIEAFEIMKDMLLTVRNGEKELKEKPLSIFSCCTTSPLKWSEVSSQNVLDCARHGIPIELISMPLSGFIAPVSLVGSLIQHTAEILSGIVFSQLYRPKTPTLYGGSAAIFDVRYETTPMGAVESQMIACAYNEIGKYLKIPTQAYIALSDAKELDAQAGLETSMGATLAGLSGINNISGPGMMDFESCISLEKLILDNEICGMTQHMLKGIQPKEDIPSLPLFQELLKEKHLLISKHTRKYLKKEHYFPGKVINRSNYSRWKEEGEKTLLERAGIELKDMLKKYEPSRLPDEIKLELTNLMEIEARKFGMNKIVKGENYESIK